MKNAILCLLAGVAVVVLVSCASAPRGSQNQTYDFTEEKVFIPSGGYVIPAIVTLPVGAPRVPAVVMLHGYGSDKDEAGGGYKLFAPQLAQAGIASIRIDFFGSGDSTVDYVDFDLNVGVANANAALAYLQSLQQVDGKRVGVMGWSMGGTIALLSAGQNRAYKAVLTWAGAPDLSGAVYTADGFAVAQKNGYYEATFDWRSSLKLSRKAYEVARDTDVLAVFAQSKAPVLALAGTLDTTVPPENAAKIAQASKNARSRSSLIPGADHTFNIFTGDMACFDALTAETLAWFRATL
jgi:dienelactone hydrolase